MSVDAHRSEILKRAFAPDAAPPKFVKFQTHDRALRDLIKIVEDGTGIGVLVGPSGAGKTAVARRLAARFRNRRTVVLLDGATHAPHQIASTMLAGLQFNVDLQTTDEMLDLLHVVAVHRTRMRCAPILIVDNFDRMPPDSLRAINRMAEFAVHGRMAIRLILLGRPGSRAVLSSTEMTNVARRAQSIVELGAVSRKETRAYLHWCLREIGETEPDRILSLDDCDRIHAVSGGLAGRFGECAIQAVEQEEAQAEPMLVVSFVGQLLARYPLEAKRIVIGRSYLSDIVVADRRASRFHALILEHADGLVVADLKSSNGTFVNSRKVELHSLANDDVISIGRYRIKLTDAPWLKQAGEPLQLQSTAILRPSRRRGPDPQEAALSAGRGTSRRGTETSGADEIPWLMPDALPASMRGQRP